MWYNAAQSQHDPFFLKRGNDGDGSPDDFSKHPYELAVRVLEEPTVVLHGITDVDRLSQYALDKTLEITGAAAGSLFLWDEFHKELRLRSARGPYSHAVRNAHIKLREGVLGLVGESGDCVLVKDINGDGRFQTVKRRGHYRSTSFISIPLISNNKLVGVMNVTERHNLRPFDEADLLKARIFCSHFAIAYENLRKIRRLEKQNETLQLSLTQRDEELRRDRPFSRVGRTVLRLAQEIHNPLDVIRRYVNLAHARSAGDGASREYLTRAQTAVQAAIRVMRGLLQMLKESENVPGRQDGTQDSSGETLNAILQDPFVRQVRADNHEEKSENEKFGPDR
jgi:signal transduction protein with GAF and PtsI domain